MTTAAQLSPRPTTGGPSATISRGGKFAYGMMLAGVILLAASGIGTFAFGKAPMTHWILMAHVAAAPLFAIGLALVALTWADRCCFGTRGSGQSGSAKVLFWLILLIGVVVILSGVVPMTPIFDTSGQHALYLTHRYSAIALAGAVVLHVLSLVRQR